MPRQVVPIENIGEIGIVTDHSSATTPIHAASSVTKNWRFADQRAYITYGYGSALANRTPNLLTKSGTWFNTFEKSIGENILYYVDIDRQLRRVSVTSLIVIDTLVSDKIYSADSHWEAFDFFGSIVFNNGVDKPFTILNPTTTFNEAPTDTTWTVDDTTDFPASGTLIIGADTYTYGSKTSTTFIGTGFPTSLTSGTIEALVSTDLSGSVKTNVLTTLENFFVAVGYNGNKRELVVTNGATSTGSSVTFPSWDITETTSADAAFLYNISGYSDGDLVGVLQLGDRLMVYTTNDVLSLSIGDPVGTDRVVITNVFSDNGLVAPRAVCNIPNSHFVIGSEQLYVHDGNTKRAIGDGIWRTEFFNRLNDDRYDELQCVYDPNSSSIWIKTPVGDDRIEMWIYDLDANALSILDDHDDVSFIRFSDQGLPGSSTALTYGDLNQDSGHPAGDWTYGTIPGGTTYQTLEGIKGAFNQRILSLCDNTICVHDFGNTFNGRSINALLRFEDKFPGYESKHVSRVTPFFNGPDGSEVVVKVGGRDNTVNNVVFPILSTFTLGISEKADARITRKYISIEFEGGVSGTSLNQFNIQVDRGGR